MTDKVEVKIVGDDSGAQGAMRRAAQAVSDATAQMRNKLHDIQTTSRAAFGSLGNDVQQAGDDVSQQTGRMSAAINTLKANFQAFTAGFGKGWRDAGNEMRQARDELGRFTAASGKKEGGGFGALEIFKGGAMLEGAKKLLEIGKAAVETASEFERLRSVLLTLEGSQAAANAKFAQLKKFGTDTPYELSEVVTAFSKLKSQGLDPSNAALTSYGNTAAAMGKSLDQMIEAVADASMGEYERLKEFGIKAVDAGDHVVFNFKGQATSVKKNSEDIQAYLQKIGNTDFAGAMNRQMDTLGGKFSNVMDAAAGLADEIGQGGLSSALKEAMDGMTGAAGTSNELARGVGEILGQAVRGVTEIVKTFVGVVRDQFALVKQIITDVFGKAAGDAYTFGNILKFVASLVSAFADVVQWAFQIAQTSVETLANMFVTLGEVIYKALTFDFSGMVDAFQDGVNRQVTIFQNGWNRMVDINKKGQERLKGINGDGKSDKADTSYASTLAAELAPAKAAPRGSSFARQTKKGGQPTVMDGWRTELQDGLLEEEKAGRDTISWTVAFWQSKLALTKAGSKQQLEVRRELSRAEIALERQQGTEQLSVIRQRQQIAEDAARNEYDLAKATLQEKLQLIDDERAAGALTAQEALAQKARLQREMRRLDREYETAQFNAKLKALEDQRDTYAAGTREYREYLRQIEVLKKQHDQRIRLLEKQDEAADRAAERQRFQQKRQAFQGIAQAWGESISKMLTLQQGFGMTVRGLWDALLGSFQQMIARMIQQWILAMLTKEAVSAASEKKAVLRDAMAAARGAFKAVVGIPVVGPILAPIAAATAFAAVGAFSAKGGYDVPDLAGPGIDGKGGQVGVVHPREMVLPADLADKVRTGSGGETHIHIHTMDTRSMARFARDNGRHLAAGVKQAVRDGFRG